MARTNMARTNMARTNKAGRFASALAVLGALLCLVLLSCYSTPQPACAFSCGGDDGACPDGYRCASDGFCKRNDVSEATVCPVNIPPDAAGNRDAQPKDAGSDAMGDGGDAGGT